MHFLTVSRSENPKQAQTCFNCYRIETSNMPLFLTDFKFSQPKMPKVEEPSKRGMVSLRIANTN